MHLPPQYTLRLFSLLRHSLVTFTALAVGRALLFTYLPTASAFLHTAACHPFSPPRCRANACGCGTTRAGVPRALHRRGFRLRILPRPLLTPRHYGNSLHGAGAVDLDVGYCPPVLPLPPQRRSCHTRAVAHCALLCLPTRTNTHTTAIHACLPQRLVVPADVNILIALAAVRACRF